MDQPKPRLDELRIERSQRPSASGAGRWFLLGLVFLLAVGAAAWAWFGRKRSIDVQVVTVREVASHPGDRTVLNASGYVTARRLATVSSKVTGKVVEIMVEEGMKVREGQVLARLDDSNVKTSLRLAEAQLGHARSALAETEVRIREADRELDRQATLLKNKIAAEADYDRAEASVRALRARLEQQRAEVVVAERQLESWQQQMDDTVIRAPFSGIVTSKNAQPGEMISPVSAGGGFTRTGICTIVDMDSLEIEIDVNESYINRVEPRQPVVATLDAYPDWKIPCNVVAIIPTADRQKSTVRVRVGFDKLDPRILPDMSVKVAFREVAAPSTAAKLVSVPRNAVHQEDQRDIAFVVQNGRAERRAITVASSNGEETLVVGGLSAGERVVLDMPKGLNDGAAVREVAAKPRP